MASTYSALKIELIGTGDQTGTWGATTNVNLGDAALGEAITGSADVAFSSADVTVTLVDTNATQTARNLRLNLTGTSGGARNLILGSGCQIEKLYLVNNGLADAVTVKNTTGTGIAVPAGTSMFVYNNGTNVVVATTAVTTLTNSALTSGRVTYAGTAGLLQDSANLTFNGTTLTANTIGAYTLSGTIAGGGNQINNVIIGTSTPLAGSFTTLSATGVATFSAGTVSLPAITTTGDTNTGIYFPAADTIAFTDGGTESMRIDSSGNLSVGTTSAFARLTTSTSAGSAGQVNGQIAMTHASATTAYFISTIRGASTNEPEGLTFKENATERMRIDSSGGVGIGATSIPAFARLQVTGTAGPQVDAKQQIQVSAPTTTANEGAGIRLDAASGSNSAVGIIGVVNNASGTLGSMTFHVYNNGGNVPEWMRITNTGNVGIGTSSPSAALSVIASPMVNQLLIGASTADSGYGSISFNGTSGATRIGFTGGGTGDPNLYYDAATSGIHQFRVNNAIKMVLDSSGNLLVGSTSATQSEKLGIYQTTANPVLFINPSNASYNATAIYTNTTRAASNAFDFIGCYGNNVGQFRVVGDGVIYAQNTSVQSISDQRLKENIRDSSDGLAVINGLRPVRYDWKVGYGNDKKNQLGFIAQEIETVFPEAVSEWQVNKNDETVYKTVGPATLIPVLVKAIQEQQALIESLTTRLTALESK